MNSNQTLVVASRNPVKIEAARRGFEKMFPGRHFTPVALPVPSGVSEQPMTDEETLTRALNRVNRAATAFSEAQYWIGIEGGVHPYGNELAAFAWVVVRSGAQLGKARSGAFFLPGAVAKLVKEGMELGRADDLVFKVQNAKQQAGAIGLLTGNAVDRMQLYEQAVVLSLVSFKNDKLYRPQ